MAVMPPGRSFRTGRLARAGFVAGLLTAGATVWWTGFLRTDPAKEWNGIEAAAAAGRWELAARHLTTWLDRHPDDRRARLLLGGVLWRIQRDDAARSVLSKIQQGDAEWARSQELLAELALRRHDAPEAERALRAVIHAEPRSTTARRRLIYLLVLEQRNEEARATLEELYALTHDVRDLITMVSLAAVEPDARDVRPELELFLAQTPNDPWLRRARGLVLLQLGQPHEAQVDLDFAARSIDDDPIGRLALGESRLLLGQTDRLPELLGPTPKRPDLAARCHALLARASESRGEDDQAIAGARRAVEIDPRLRDAHYRLGQLLLRRGPDQAAEAKRHLDRAEALRTAEALFKAELNEAIAGRRDTPRFERLARLSFDAGLGASGRAWLEQALTGDPTQSALQAELARLGATSPAPVNPSPVIPRLRSTPREETMQARAVSEPSSGSSPSTPRFENIAERSGASCSVRCRTDEDLLHWRYDGGRRRPDRRTRPRRLARRVPRDRLPAAARPWSRDSLRPTGFSAISATAPFGM
ncbi:MAG: tetratricopeptide repeat protein [Isosphaeraceae bacterium]